MVDNCLIVPLEVDSGAFAPTDVDVGIHADKTHSETINLHDISLMRSTTVCFIVSIEVFCSGYFVYGVKPLTPKSIALDGVLCSEV